MFLQKIGLKEIFTARFVENPIKVTLPTTIKKLAGDGFCFCKQLSEVIIPESSERIDFGVSNLNFQWNGTPLSVLWEKHKKLGADDPVKSA